METRAGLSMLEQLAKRDSTISQPSPVVNPDFGDAPVAGMENVDPRIFHRMKTRRRNWEELSELELENIILSLEKSIEFMRQDQDVATRLSSELASRFHDKFRRAGKNEDLDRAIALQEQVVSSCSPRMLSEALYGLGIKLDARFQHRGSESDLQSGMQHLERSVSLISNDHPDMVMRLSALASLYNSRFFLHGQLSDLDASIAHLDQAVSIPNGAYNSKLDSLTNLAYMLETRFVRLKTPDDIERSIRYHKQAISMARQRGFVQSSMYNNCGLALQSRYSWGGSPTDIEEAIDCFKEAIELLPRGSPYLPSCMSNLGSVLLHRFAIKNDLSKINSLHDAIKYQQDAVDLCVRDSTRQANWSGNLANAYKIRYLLQRQIPDIQKACHYYKLAIRSMPDGHVSKVTAHLQLAETYRAREDSLGTALSIMEYWTAANIPSGQPEYRLQAALECARISRPFGLIRPFNLAIELLPRVVWLGTSVNRRYKEVSKIRSLALEAAAAAIQFENYDLGVEWLESGRSIVWNQILQLRTPLDDLASVRPDLATRLREIAAVIEADGAFSQRDSSSYTGTLPGENTAQRHRRMAEEWDQRVEEIRCVPSFGDFLRNKQANELNGAAQSGPVVVLNMHESRCDALLILPKSGSIVHVPLPNFSWSKAQESYARLVKCLRSQGIRERGIVRRKPPVSEQVFESVLASLWIDVVQPVLQALGYTNINTSPENAPHVTWCLTGYLSFLPIHAAGIHGQLGSRIYDYVVSSYTPTLGTLMKIARRKQKFCGMLAIGQAQGLPKVSEELSHVARHIGSTHLMRLDGREATAEAVLEGMKACSWVHLACHAKQDMANPRASGFLLHDRTLDLTMITKEPLEHAEFAFLSACQTATGDESMPEEAVHIAAGMLMAGYSSVIATMWSIQDDHAPLIADKVYAHMLKDGVPDSRKAAVALHEAVKSLREKIGEKEYGSWVPYIHMGL